MSNKVLMKGNEAIAEAFHYMHIVEAWGTGLPRIISRCREYGLPAPLFEEFGDGFKAILFRRERKLVNQVKESDYKHDTQADTQHDTQHDTQVGIQHDTQDTSKDVLSRIAELIRQDNKITTKDIAQELGVSVSTVKRRIKSIPNISYIGSGFSGHWEIRD